MRVNRSRRQGSSNVLEAATRAYQRSSRSALEIEREFGLPVGTLHQVHPRRENQIRADLARQLETIVHKFDAQLARMQP